MPTFAEAARATFDKKKAGWSERTAKDWQSKLERLAFPVIGDIPVDAITLQHLIVILLPRWKSKHVSALKLKQAIGQVLAGAVASEYITENLAESSALDEALPSVNYEVKHQRALHHSEAPEALNALIECGASKNATLSISFQILTGCRPNEAMGSKWYEIDLDAKVWSIGKERMKMSSDHRVALSESAVAVLREARKLGRGAYVFPSVKPGVPVTKGACYNVLKKAGLFTNRLPYTAFAHALALGRLSRAMMKC